MPLVKHLIELRKRLLYSFLALFCAFIVSYPFSQAIFGFLVRPLSALMGEGRRLIYTGLAEAFVTYIKVAFFGAACLSFPLILSQVWVFIAPGLYTHERRTFLGILIATPCLFFLGAALAYYVVCPLAWAFFLSFEATSSAGCLPIQLEARVSEYLTLMMRLIFAFGLSFQLPIALLLCARMGFVQSQQLKKKRKYAFLIIVIGAAIVTPPDFLTPISLIVPLYGLYELSIYLIGCQERIRMRLCSAQAPDKEKCPLSSF